MKAGLITFHYAHHYGAQLQAYALYKTIEKLGYPCEIIDYVRPDTVEGSRLFKMNPSLGSTFSNIHTILHLSSFRRRHLRFNSFVKKQMKLSRKHYTSFDELLEDPPVYDCYLCGSDQIWNPLIFTPKGFDPSFFMLFAKEKKRIAYAPSFGISAIPGCYMENLREYLAGFHALSARELTGSEIIQNLTGRTAEVVLDPTLLPGQSEWLRIASKARRSTPYILCYFVSDPTPFYNTVHWVSKVLKLPILTLCGSRKPIPGSVGCIYDAGPEEFLALIRDASFVCTNSFHGMVFSILFQRDFYCLETKKRSSEQSVNSRLHSILDKLRLDGRLLSGTESLPDKEIKGLKIDYAPVVEKLDTERKRSLQYLRRAFE